MSNLSGKEVAELHKKYILQSWSKAGVDALPVEKAKGIYFWDYDGNKYADMASLLVCSNLGHELPEIVNAIKEQADKMCFMAPAYASEPKSKLAKLLIEAAGAMLLLPVFVSDYGLKGIWMAAFHSVSAFCNAGFDILGTADNAFPSLTGYSGNILINVVIMLLIITGGIGFLTWDDIYTNKLNIKRYRMQSKIILMTTAGLILFPTVFFFVCDLKNLPMRERLLAAMFQSVTTRTAGFNTINISEISEASKAVMILLMLIGGSPGSTAGGMKTTTFTVLILNAIATFRSQENAGAFGRRLEYHVIKNAATIAMLYFTLFFCGGIAISVYEGLPLLDCLYEAASAVGTVGLTLGVTPGLHVFSQVVLIILMYLGRVGGLTLIYAVFSGRNKGNAKLPLEKITVG